MGLETFGDIDDLVPTNPVDTTDTVASMAAHIRGLKTTLQTDFPSITGPVTATQTELNLIDGQEGALLLKGIATAGGSVNALTADFTPDVTLTNNVTVIVEATGANTSSTVTFAPDGLTAKNIKKNGNQALSAGDINAAGHRLILSYDSGNDVWELLNPAGEQIPTVTGYTGGSVIYIHDNASASGFSISANVGAAWESVGPTGSGATNIWTDLDDVPTSAIAVIVRVVNSLGGSTNADQYTSIAYGRSTGSAYAAGTSTKISGVEFYNRSGSLESGQSTDQIHLPVDSSVRFDLYYTQSGTTPTIVCSMVLVGWIE